jgi:hypothetical protein
MRRYQNATNAIGLKLNRSKINEADRYPAAHNGLVAGSSPAGPTSESIALAVPHFAASWPPHQKCLASLLPVVLQQSAGYFSGFDLATISSRDRIFGGIFA